MSLSHLQKIRLPHKNEDEKPTELVLVSTFKISVSIFTVDEHLWSPAARQSTATHCAMENKACFAIPPD